MSVVRRGSGGRASHGARRPAAAGAAVALPAAADPRLAGPVAGHSSRTLGHVI